MYQAWVWCGCTSFQYGSQKKWYKISVKGFRINYICIFLIGAAVNISMVCNDGHSEVWCSSKSIKAGRLMVPLINISLTFYLFFSGLHWDQIKVRLEIWKIFYFLLYQAFFNKLGVVSISKSTFYRNLKSMVYPCTYEFWLKDQAQTINEVLVVDSFFKY